MELQHDLPDIVDLPGTIYEPLLSIRPHFMNRYLPEALQMFTITPGMFIDAVKRYEAGREVAGHHCQRYWAYTLEHILVFYSDIDVWMLFWIQLPLLDQLHDRVEKCIIRAQPQTANKPGAFDVVFVDMDPHSVETQNGIHSMLFYY